jgi:hypothetical protein
MKRKIPFRLLILFVIVTVGCNGIQAGSRRGRDVSRHVFIRPHIGARSRMLPPGYMTIYAGGLPYFYYFGTYYRYYPDEYIYVVVEKPREISQQDSAKADSTGFDKVTLVDGSTLEGIYLGGTMTTVQLQIGGEVHEIDISEIASIIIAPKIKEQE